MNASPPKTEVTLLLQQMRDGDQAAAERLIRHVYQDLRRLASHIMRSERAGHTLQPTALVHEAFLRMCGEGAMDWQNRAHFFAVAARQMRQILVDHARRARAAKRGAGFMQITLDHVGGLRAPQEDVLAVDLALSKLEKSDPRAAQVVEMKFFGGLTDKEVASVQGVSLASVRRDWDFARAWLFTNL
ncbi:MAG TPA: ECF-type sigma factor [Bryobacteraceae bacterium]|nr:ECF-type sigma factor [Bryobacteraceae bacterium]